MKRRLGRCTRKWEDGIVTCLPIARQRVDKHILTATMEELPFLCNCNVNTSITIEELLGNGVSCGVRAEKA
jgi:hypothetical protein